MIVVWVIWHFRWGIYHHALLNLIKEVCVFLDKLWYGFRYFSRLDRLGFALNIVSACWWTSFFLSLLVLFRHWNIFNLRYGWSSHGMSSWVGCCWFVFLTHIIQGWLGAQMLLLFYHISFRCDSYFSMVSSWAKLVLRNVKSTIFALKVLYFKNLRLCVPLITTKQRLWSMCYWG